MSGWWFSDSASSATWLTSATACRNDGSSTVRSSAPPESIQSAENFILRWISPREGSPDAYRLSHRWGRHDGRGRRARDPRRRPRWHDHHGLGRVAPALQEAVALE